jgi:hypothetical protein
MAKRTFYLFLPALLPPKNRLPICMSAYQETIGLRGKTLRRKALNPNLALQLLWIFQELIP